ncbi:DUF1102 domain-containing protein [Natronococcus sp.]|uniref:DUF1102 domain-containing protein n=1 Tax=Natronococcus sp. TaxID=35747 RepID=UPI0025F3BE3A|nr:DUF1102 domain-containing protein [Natronococcus sp.]
MKRRRLLAALGATAAGSSAILSSGAFSSVEADRDMNIQVAEDANAYLGLSECSLGDPNVEYLSVDENTGVISIDLSPSNPTDAGGEGVNAEATTLFDNVFQAVNQGTQDIDFWIEIDPMENDAKEPSVEFYRNSCSSCIIDETDPAPIKLGESQCVGMKVATEGISPGTSLIEDETILIHAEER